MAVFVRAILPKPGRSTLPLLRAIRPPAAPRPRCALPLLHQRAFLDTPSLRTNNYSPNPERPPRPRIIRPGTPEWHEYHVSNARPLFGMGRGKRPRLGRKGRYFVAGMLVFAAVYYVTHLEQVPVTGRWRFNCFGDAVTEKTEMMAKRVLYEMQKQGVRFLPVYDRRVRMVKDVMERLIPVSGLTNYNWEIYVVDVDEPNAMVLPGGKVIVNTGILNLVHNQSALAVVLAHEVAHCIAQHPGERLSAALIPDTILWSVGILISPVFPLFLTLTIGGIFYEFLFGLPMSRNQEREADYIGLMLMAEACYDPREATNFWRTMAYVEKRVGERLEYEHAGVLLPPWAKTHPASTERIRNLEGWMPKALEQREKSDCHHTSSWAALFKEAMVRGMPDSL